MQGQGRGGVWGEKEEWARDIQDPCLELKFLCDMSTIENTQYICVERFQDKKCKTKPYNPPPPLQPPKKKRGGGRGGGGTKRMARKEAGS